MHRAGGLKIINIINIKNEKKRGRAAQASKQAAQADQRAKRTKAGAAFLFLPIAGLHQKERKKKLASSREKCRTACTNFS